MMYQGGNNDCSKYFACASDTAFHHPVEGDVMCIGIFLDAPSSLESMTTLSAGRLQDLLDDQIIESRCVRRATATGIPPATDDCRHRCCSARSAILLLHLILARLNLLLLSLLGHCVLVHSNFVYLGEPQRDGHLLPDPASDVEWALRLPTKDRASTTLQKSNNKHSSLQHIECTWPCNLGRMNLQGTETHSQAQVNAV